MIEAAGSAAAGGGPTVGELPGVAYQLLSQRGETVATAESLTAGLLSGALTSVPGSSATFRGGLIVYATDLKASLAGVPADLLDRCGPVSSEVAAALSTGVRDRLDATWGLALTGVAGPDQQDGHPVGTVFVGIAGPARPAEVRPLRLSGDRTAIRAAAVEAACECCATASPVPSNLDR